MASESRTLVMILDLREKNLQDAGNNCTESTFNIKNKNIVWLIKYRR